jgi:protein O-mannosyl-transferase
LLTLRSGLAGAALIIVATCVAYLPVLRGAFILDDNKLLTENSLIKASDGLYRFWCSTEPQDYWPATNTSLWLEWRLWGTNPTGYHVTNLLLHIGAALLVWATLRKLAIPGAFLAALLFAVHPVNVESVAWIAQRKNTLAMVFFLLSILWYLKADIERPPGEHQGVGRWYGLSLLAFTLAMLSKGSVAILPLVLLGIAWWQRQRITKSDLAMTVPFFVVAIVFTCANIWFQKHGTDVVIRDVSFSQRLAGAASAIWFYLAKALLPIDLVFVYPQWLIKSGQWQWWLPLLAVVIVTLLLWWRRNTWWGRPLLAAWGLFCVALVPVLGFADVGFMKYSLVADHYQYIAIVGVLALVAAAWSAWHKRLKRPTAQRAASVIAVGVVGGLAFLTFKQSLLYSDPVRLYEDTLTKNPGCSLVHNNLGGSLIRMGRPNNAIAPLQEALRLKPDYAMAHYNLGNALLQTGHPEEAIEHYQQALRLNPDYAEAHYNLGTVLSQTGRPQEAIEHYQQAIRLNPDYAEAHNNLGNALFQTGRPQEAIEHCQQSLRLNPDNAEAHYNLGNALFQTGHPQEAIEHFQQALRLKPNYSEAHNNLGNALFQTGHPQEAIEHFQQAIRLKPDFAEAHNNLGTVLSQAGRSQEAIEHYKQAIRLNPDDAQAYLKLAAVQAQVHRSQEAISTAQRAIDIAKAHGQTALAGQIEAWLKSYRAEQASTPAGSANPDAPSPQK